jgi:hypothetical protein
VARLADGGDKVAEGLVLPEGRVGRPDAGLGVRELLYRRFTTSSPLLALCTRPLKHNDTPKAKGPRDDEHVGAYTEELLERAVERLDVLEEGGRAALGVGHGADERALERGELVRERVPEERELARGMGMLLCLGARLGDRGGEGVLGGGELSWQGCVRGVSMIECVVDGPGR